MKTSSSCPHGAAVSTRSFEVWAASAPRFGERRNMTAAPQTNDRGYVVFKSCNRRYAGDRATWARYDAATRTLTVARAAKGIISGEYDAELTAFCAEHGINWAAVRCGDRVTVTLSPEESAEADTSADAPAMTAEARAAYDRIMGQAAAATAKMTAAPLDELHRQLEQARAAQARLRTAPAQWWQIEAGCRIMAAHIAGRA